MQNKAESFQKNNLSEVEKTPGREATPEEYEEMLGQVPALKEMLHEAREELETLQKNPEADPADIALLEEQITDLEADIADRLEAAGVE